MARKRGFVLLQAEFYDFSGMLADDVERVTTAASIKVEVDHESVRSIEFLHRFVEPALEGWVKVGIEGAAQGDLSNSVARCRRRRLLDGVQFRRRESMLDNFSTGENKGVDFLIVG